MNTRRVFLWSITVALGGFLFGFDTAVISGAEQEIQKVWSLSDAMVGQMVAIALYGTVIGALFGGYPADSLGRKKSLFWIAILYFVSAAGSALAPGIYSLMFFRFIGGLGVGASSVIAPMYIAEIAPREKRGQLTAMFQFNIVLGIVLAYLSNYLIGADEQGSWRLMLGVQCFPALLFLVLILTVPRSPRWLIVKKGLVDEARRVLEMINPATVEENLKAIQQAAKTPHHTSGLKEFFSGKYSFPILLAFLIAFFNQTSGINAVIYYAPRIFSDTGMAEGASLLSSVGIGIVNLIFTMVGLSLIDRMGRKFLMFIGSFGYIVSLASVAYVFMSEAESPVWLVPVLLFVFIASHAIGQGAVIWVFITEIFPNQVRSYGNSLGAGTHWIFAALIAAVFPWIAGELGTGPTFAVFAVMMVFQLLFVWKVMPETKGKSLEELETVMLGKK